MAKSLMGLLTSSDIQSVQLQFLPLALGAAAIPMGPEGRWENQHMFCLPRFGIIPFHR